MSGAELTVDDKPLSPIQIFCVKVVIVTAAALAMFYVADLVIKYCKVDLLFGEMPKTSFWRWQTSRIFLLRRRKKSSMPFENSHLNTNHISTH